MNRGFSYYFKKSNDIFSFVFHKQKFSAKLAFWVYVVASMIGKCIFFIRPIFLISDQNVANMCVNGHSFSILKAFQGVSKKYGSLFIAELINFSLCMAALIGVALIFAGPILGLLSFDSVAIVISIIASLVYVAVLFFIYFQFRFVSFLAAKTRDLDCSDYLYNSHAAFKGNAQTIVAQEVVYFLLADLLPLICVGGVIVLSIATGDKAISILFGILSIVVVPAVFIFLGAPFGLKKQICIYLMGEDFCSTNKSIVVKRRASSAVEYEPIFDTPSELDGVDLNK